MWKSYCHSRLAWTALSLTFLLLAFYPSMLEAESKIENVSCGQFLEREFDEPNQLHDYKIWMEPGEKIDLRVVPIGETLLVRAYVFEPAGERIAESSYVNEIRLSSGKLSGRGFHLVRIGNAPYRDGSGESRVGVYGLTISCIRSDGSRVEPGAQNRGPATGEESKPSVQSPSGDSQGEATEPNLKILGKYAEDVQKVQNTATAVQETIGGVAGAVDAARDLWSKIRGGKEKRGASDGNATTTDSRPSPVYQRPEDLVERGRPPVYAEPVEASAASRPAVPGTATASQPSTKVDRRTFPLLGLGTILQGEVTPSFRVQGCRFQAQAGQRIDLVFERLAGDLDLVVTVFAPDQRLVFQTSVLASPRVSTTLQLPVEGEYAVEVAAMGSGATNASLAHFSLRLTAAPR